ncbi:uncharacterized protein LOC130445155 [Diorhabda sublineata]|uniref:uncharacterized protein LOC130445155 n=1 Tax=Diorhabda sublineata TaxID=1163346 RepID=UPI0024E18002|nr:uncharacterized protein LOC130445155 [Diorhabda sublineata]
MENAKGNHQTNNPNDIQLKESRSRPCSFYENSGIEPLNTSNNNVSKDENSTRSQITFVNTTVPVNMTTQDIAGKHTPTRNSLRHSRMIVMNKTGEAPTNTTITLHHHKFIRFLLVGILVIGLAMCITSLWLLLWTPNLRSKDNPGWGGIPVLVSSFAGILFTTSIPNPKGYSGRKYGYWQKTLKYVSIFTSTMAACTSLLTFVFSLLHVVGLNAMTCAPPEKLDSTCFCSFNTTETSVLDTSYHYVDLGCEEVQNILNVLIIFVSVISILAFIFELFYLYMHWVNRDIRKYSRVPINVNAFHIHRENR